MVVGVFVLMLASFIVNATRRPDIPMGVITTPHPQPIGDSLVGPTTQTLDASSSDQWTYFDFSRNAAVTNPGPLDWDIAVRRFYIIANGGPGFPGQAGLADLGAISFDSLRVLPDSAFQVTAKDSVNPAIRRWYDYGFSSHILRSKNHVYAVRTADGKYAKLQVVSYYCGEATPGCFTIRYAYQGNGTRSFAPTAR